MRFFTPITGFSHYGRFYGFPCYFANLSSDAPLVVGTNVVWGWCIDYVAPAVHKICEVVGRLADPHGYQPAGWRLEVLGEL